MNGSAWPVSAALLPWDCRVSDCQRRNGVMVPTLGEAAWLRREGRKPYFIGTLTSLVYEFSTLPRQRP